MAKRVQTDKEREVRMCAEMWHTSRCLLVKGQEQVEGCHHQFMGSLVFTAFTLEAYLNHVGLKIFKCWKDIERLGPKEKVNVIAERIGLEIDLARRPWQVLKDLYGFRNDIAHGKTVFLRSSETVPLDEYQDNGIPENIPTKWEKYCNKKNAEKAREDVETIIFAIHEAARVEEGSPLAKGCQFTQSSLIE